MNSSELSPRRKAEIELSRRELARRHLLDFVNYNYEGYDCSWHHRIIAEKLEAVERGDIKRLMLFLPPRSGKSELGAVQFPAWAIGRNPKRDIITASYSAELAVDFGRRVRNLVNEPTYQNIFKTKLADDSKSAGRWNTSSGGAYLAAGVGGGVTGRGAHILILDDCIKNREEAESETVRKSTLDWFKSTAYTRLAPDGAIIIIMTRWHDADLAGTLLEEARKDPSVPQWEVISFPAIAETQEEFRDVGEALWPSRYTLQSLLDTKATIGTYDWSSLYQQNPLNEGSQEFKKSYFQYRDAEQVRGLMTRNYLTIDTAISQKASADSTGFCDNSVDAENRWNLRAWRKKLSPLELIDQIFTLHRERRYEQIGIEKTIYYDTLKPFLDQEMRLRNVFLPIFELQHGGRAKELRIRGLLPRYESRSIYHINGECSDLEEEALRFPKGVHDDVLDATAYMLQIAESPFSQHNKKVAPPLRTYANRFR